MKAERVHAPMKPRIQGKILNLPKAQLERLHDLLNQNRTYAEIQNALKEEFEVTISRSSLSSYYQGHALEFMALPKQKERDAANELPFGISIHLHFHLHHKGEEKGR
jgi:transposase